MALQDRNARVWLFQLKYLQGEKGKLSFNVTREACEYLADPILAHVTSTSLRFFNFHCSTWSPYILLRTKIQADSSSSWVILEDSCIFCCGGNQKAAAYILGCDGSVKQKANMNAERGGHGLLAASNPYVFGGYGLQTCEKLELHNSKWIPLPSMREARWSFNPCMLLGTVYLCGGNSATMEAFTPQTDAFFPLHVMLPQSCGACCLYFHNHLLVLHSYGCILKFAVEPNGQLTKHSIRSAAPTFKFQNSHPVVDKEKGVFYVIFNWECCSFFMKTGRKGPTVK